MRNAVHQRPVRAPLRSRPSRLPARFSPADNAARVRAWLVERLPSPARKLWWSTTRSACVRGYGEADNATVAAAKLGENGYLRPALEAGLEAAAERGLPVKLRLEHPFQCSEWRSRPGVDIGVRGLPHLAPVFCELKWGDGPRVLGECSWDLARWRSRSRLRRAPLRAQFSRDAGVPRCQVHDRWMHPT